MRHSARCTQLVLSFEGLVLKAYPDPATKSNPWTIGVGHTGPEVHKGLVWTKQQALDMLDSDLANFDAMVESLLGPAQCTQYQFDALVSFCFNVGYGNLRKSSLLRYHKLREYKAAEGEFGKWVKAAGKVMPGLVKRRAAEARMYGGYNG